MSDNLRLVRKIPIDWGAIAEESGCTQGTLCKTAFGWGIRNGDGPADFCCITPPEVGPGEELRIVARGKQGAEWGVYAQGRAGRSNHE
jgi:hypothetical protein